MGLGEIRTWRAIGIDDAFGQEIQHLLSLVFWHISGEEVIEAAILADDDDNVLDRGGRLDAIDSPVGFVIAVANGNIRQHRKCQSRCA